MTVGRLGLVIKRNINHRYNSLAIYTGDAQYLVSAVKSTDKLGNKPIVIKHIRGLSIYVLIYKNND
jgi:hypothetical protein